MADKTMLNKNVMLGADVTNLSDKAFRLYVNMLLFSDDDGTCTALPVAQAVSRAGNEELYELEDSGLMKRLDITTALIMDWLKHNNISNKTYRNLAPAEIRSKIRVHIDGRYTVDDMTDTVTIDEFREKRAAKTRPKGNEERPYQMQKGQKYQSEEGQIPDERCLCGKHSNIPLHASEIRVLEKRYGAEAGEIMDVMSAYVESTGDMSGTEFKNVIMIADQIAAGKMLSHKDISRMLHGSFEDAIMQTV